MNTPDDRRQRTALSLSARLIVAAAHTDWPPAKKAIQALADFATTAYIRLRLRKEGFTVSALTALRAYASARRSLADIEVRLGDTETPERENAIAGVIAAWEPLPACLLWAGRIIDRHAYRQAGVVVTAPVYRTRLSGIPAALRRYAAAERALCEADIADYAARVEEDTPEFLRANHEVTAASASVPWPLLWVTALITRRIVRELDYFNRTGQPQDRPALAWWASWLAFTVVAVTGSVLIVGAVTRTAHSAAPSPLPAIFTPAPVPAASPASPGCAR